jgi:hypothetical protein
MKRKLELSYDVVERNGRQIAEVSVSNGDESVVIFHEEVNSDYMHGGAEGAAWGMIVEYLADVFRDES